MCSGSFQLLDPVEFRKQIYFGVSDLSEIKGPKTFKELISAKKYEKELSALMPMVIKKATDVLEGKHFDWITTLRGYSILHANLKRMLYSLNLYVIKPKRLHELGYPRFMQTIPGSAYFHSLVSSPTHSFD